jgi:hypothetical protein
MTTIEKSGCKDTPLPYRLRDDFLSPAELNFYRVLQQAVGDAVIISLEDLFYAKSGNRNQNNTYRNKIRGKQLTFLRTRLMKQAKATYERWPVVV